MSDLKAAVAQAALAYIADHRIIGVGTGSTVNYFIKALAQIKQRIDGCVASSKATALLLRQAGLPVVDLNGIDDVPIYIDGADEVNPHFELIKGGGGALTGEKIVASSARSFLCLVDESKLVRQLGQFPIAVEVISMARGLVARELVQLGGNPVYRSGFVTDQGHIILDLFHGAVEQAGLLEGAINHIPGVVENGLFSRRRADTVLVAGKQGVYELAKG